MIISIWEKILYSLRFKGYFLNIIGLGLIYLLLILFSLNLLMIILNAVGQLFNRREEDERAGKRHIFYILFIPLTFMLVMSIGIPIFLGDSDTANALSHSTLIYEVDGTSMIATLTDDSFAMSTGEYGTHSRSYNYLSVVSAEDGKERFKKLIDGGYYDAKLLGVSEENIFVLSQGVLISFDKKTGKVTNKLKGADSNVAFVTDSSQSYFDGAQGIIFVRGDDGQVYEINTDNLQIKTSNIDPIKIFPEKSMTFPNYTNGLTIIHAQENQFTMLMTDADVQNVKSGNEIPSISSDKAERRFNYQGSLEQPDELKKINNDVYLLGSFLFTNEIGGGQYPFAANGASDFTKFGKENKDLLWSQYLTISARGSVINNLPFQTENKEVYYIVHHKSIERTKDSILFTAINTNTGEALWTVDLMGLRIKNYIMLDKTHMLIFMDDNSRIQDGSSHFIKLDLENGSGFAYNYKYNFTQVLLAND